MAEFLEEAYPDHGPKLLPPDPYWRAISRIWIDFVTSRFIPAFHRFLQHQPGTSTSLEQVRSEFLDILKQFTKEMHPEGPYFLGSEISLVDITIAPWEVRFWIFDHFKGGLGIPAEGQGGEDEKIWARWRKWSTAINERKSFKETMSDKDHYIPIYQR